MQEVLMELKKEKTRVGFGHGLVDLGEKDERVVVLTADVKGSVNVNFFADKFPERFVQCGVQEQNMTLVGAGLSLLGKIAFISTYSCFAAYRNLDMIRISLCYSNVNVKIGASHGGLMTGPDGATHQALEEFAIMRALPNMKLIVPCDYWEARKATIAAAGIDGPVYLRLGRESVPMLTNEETPFEFGKGSVMRDGGDVAIVACGVMVYEAMVAAEALAGEGIDCRVINLHTLKPIDSGILTQAATECGAIVTAEEHQIHGGLGSAVADTIALTHPVPIEYVAVKDSFGQSGTAEELLTAYGLKATNIVDAVNLVLKRKR